MAEVTVPRELFAAILDRIQRFGVPPPGERSRSTLASGNGSDLAFKHRPLSSAWSFGIEIEPESGKIATLESANGKSPLMAAFGAIRHGWVQFEENKSMMGTSNGKC